MFGLILSLLLTQNWYIDFGAFGNFLKGRADYYGQEYTVIPIIVLTHTGNLIEAVPYSKVEEFDETEKIIINLQPDTKIIKMPKEPPKNTKANPFRGVKDYRKFGRTIKLNNFPQVFRGVSTIPDSTLAFLICKKPYSTATMKDLEEIKEVYFFGK